MNSNNSRHSVIKVHYNQNQSKITSENLKEKDSKILF